MDAVLYGCLLPLLHLQGMTTLCPICREEVKSGSRTTEFAAGLAVRVEKFLRCENCGFEVVHACIEETDGQTAVRT